MRTTRRGVRWHRTTYCEANDCTVKFLRPGLRHHCRACGRSVCSSHFSRPLCSSCSAPPPPPPPPDPDVADSSAAGPTIEESNSYSQKPTLARFCHCCRCCLSKTVQHGSARSPAAVVDAVRSIHSGETLAMTGVVPDCLTAEQFAEFADARGPLIAKSGASPKDLLQIYGLYKQALVGDCPKGNRPWGLKPGMKHDAWRACAGMDSKTAMRSYVARVEALTENRAAGSSSDSSS